MLNMVFTVITTKSDAIVMKIQLPSQLHSYNIHKSLLKCITYEIQSNQERKKNHRHIHPFPFPFPLHFPFPCPCPCPCPMRLCPPFSSFFPPSPSCERCNLLLVHFFPFTFSFSSHYVQRQLFGKGWCGQSLYILHHPLPHHGKLPHKSLPFLILSILPYSSV